MAEYLYCPLGDGEFEVGVSHCPVCDSVLVGAPVDGEPQVGGADSDPSPRRVRLRPSWALGLVMAAVLAGIVVWSIGAMLNAIGDFPPSGPECDWEWDEGSGPGGSGGQEEIRWGYFPTKYCVLELGDGSVHEDYLGGALIAPLAAPIVVVGVLLVGRWELVRFVPGSTR